MSNSKENLINKPSNSGFKQQRLNGLRCAPSFLTLTFVYLSLGIILILFGVLILSESNKVEEFSYRYDNLPSCKANFHDPPTCSISFSIPSLIKSPIFLYYEIKGMYQNHRRYNKCRDIYQLMGTIRSVSEIQEYCNPIVTMKDLGFNSDLSLKNDDPANPCGLIAKSFFNDSFSLEFQNKTVPISSSNIAWSIDKAEKFKKSKDSDAVQWVDVEDGKE
jgi:hypothetical protein